MTSRRAILGVVKADRPVDLFEVFCLMIEAHNGHPLTKQQRDVFRRGYDRGREEARSCLVPAGRAFLVEVERIRLEQAQRRLAGRPGSPIVIMDDLVAEGA